ncbi:MAG: FAD-dependent oxidoreductase [Dehalococcoidia bacterium]|nr:FAD-dependent oxidoreductase [Dehalococcoidia bacterium]
MFRRVAVIGDSISAAEAALTLAEMGVEVSLVVSTPALDLAQISDRVRDPQDVLRIWPLLLRASRHPHVTLHTNSEVKSVTGKLGRFTIRGVRKPRYVREDLCTSCGLCAESCSVQVPFVQDGRRMSHAAIHAPISDLKKTVPSAFYIEKTGISPCRAACPLGINVQGFVSLLSKGKTEEALALINEAAPLAGILGRVCTHPCEEDCKRSEIDSPVFIRALHRFAADNSPGIHYRAKAPLKSRKEKVAIVGSGPAGLTAAWELARRGYHATIFESHAVIGGMIATGVPRFRLPREVRDREVEAIKSLGVDMQTGVRVGRDVTISDLRERGYRSFFIAIGAHENNKLNIPGEELDGVVDSVSLLFALNLKFGSVGQNVVVIGGGNSAVDSARTVKRRGKGNVRILYRRTEAEMTAVKEEVEEAIREGITIEYLTAPVEILGDGSNVTGIRCVRMTLGDVGADGRRQADPIPGSEFILDADHVVAAIGQYPNSLDLNIRWLEIDSESSTIKVDPLTLETNIPGIFSGGDCVTGPNNVVEAVASGLRAAESIDRYLRGRDLRKGRTLERPEPVQVDVREREASYYKRARMTGIPYTKRMGSFEETTLGLPPEIAFREATRCLNCALCSECKECERACQQDAVFHKNVQDPVEIQAALVLNFIPAGAEMPSYLPWRSPHSLRSGIHTVEEDEGRNLEDELALASSIAMRAATGIMRNKEAAEAAPVMPLEKFEPKLEPQGTPRRGRDRIGVVLCNCGGSISSVVDFNKLSNEALQVPDVCIVRETSQACSEEGAKRIALDAEGWNLDKVVVAACRCCGFDQICFSCTDRRVMCQQNLSLNMNSRYVEFANIREQCARVHAEDPDEATAKAVRIVSSAIARARAAQTAATRESPIKEEVLVIGSGIRGLSAAVSLLAQGYRVSIVSGGSARRAAGINRLYMKDRAALVKRLEGKNFSINKTPAVLEVDGPPGCYQVALKYPSETKMLEAGAIILDIGKQAGQTRPGAPSIPAESLLGNIISRQALHSHSAASVMNEFTRRNTAGIFVMWPDEYESIEQQKLKGEAVAARASMFMGRGTVTPLTAAVTINEKLCRGCGDCAAICPYITMKSCEGDLRACVDRALCLGCGACVSVCPTGAIGQYGQSDTQIFSTLEILLGAGSGGTR